MGFVYKITCIPSAKSYIGISVNEPEKDRIQKHLSGRGSRLLASAIKKYGKDVFTYEILEENVFPELLPELEVFYISKFNTVAKNGYNLTHGGEPNKRLSDETRHKMSESMKGRTAHNKGKSHSLEARHKMSEAKKGEKSYYFGKKLSSEHRRKMSEAKKGKKRSAETRRKISESSKGKIISLEHRQKLSKANKGEKNHFYGKKHSSETRLKMSSPHKQTAHQIFLALPEEMALPEKRRILLAKFSGLASNVSVYRWVSEWLRSS